VEFEGRRTKKNGGGRKMGKTRNLFTPENTITLINHPSVLLQKQNILQHWRPDFVPSSRREHLGHFLRTGEPGDDGWPPGPTP
jgi:hypothetical protein